MTAFVMPRSVWTRSTRAWAPGLLPFVATVGLVACGGDERQLSGAPDASLAVPRDAAGPEDAGPPTDAGASSADAGTSDSGAPACLAVANELGEEVLDRGGLAADYVARAEACGFRVAAFDDLAAAASWLGQWRLSSEDPGRYDLDGSRVVAVDGRLLLAVQDATPNEATATLALVADDEVLCETVTHALRWPPLGDGRFAALADLEPTRVPIDEQRLDRCRYGRVHAVRVAPFDDLAQAITPVAELQSPAGGSRLWSETVLIEQRDANAGFTVVIARSLLREGAEHRLTFGATAAMHEGACRNVFAETSFTEAAGLPQGEMTMRFAQAVNPRLCRPRTTTTSVYDGYLLIR